MGLTRPAPLDVSHDLTAFTCGEPAVDHWLRTRARKNQISGASAVYVVCEGLRVVGFYAPATSGISRTRARSRFSRGTPDPIHIVLLGQLGVDVEYQGQGLAAALVRDALIRSLAVSEQAGVAAVYVDVLYNELMPFYRSLGFDAISEAEPTAMMIRMKDIRAALRR